MNNNYKTIDEIEMIFDEERKSSRIVAKGTRDRRRVQFTMLSFLYAYERNLSIDIITSYCTKGFKTVNCSTNFYRFYNYISKDERLYKRKLLVECGRKLLSNTFYNLKDSLHKTSGDVACINYFLIKSLDIDITKYTRKIDVRRSVPFIDIDIEAILRDRWHIDFVTFYKMIDESIGKRIVNYKRYGKDYRIHPIDIEEVRNIVQLSRFGDSNGKLDIIDCDNCDANEKIEKDFNPDTYVNNVPSNLDIGKSGMCIDKEPLPDLNKTKEDEECQNKVLMNCMHLFDLNKVKRDVDIRKLNKVEEKLLIHGEVIKRERDIELKKMELVSKEIEKERSGVNKDLGKKSVLIGGFCVSSN